MALAAALGQGALPRLKSLGLNRAAISDAGLVALAPALRRLPPPEEPDPHGNPFSNEGLAALVAPPPPAGGGAPPPPTGGPAKPKALILSRTQITDAGCATLASALDSGALPALERLYILTTPLLAPRRQSPRHSGAGEIESRRALLSGASVAFSLLSISIFVSEYLLP